MADLLEKSAERLRALGRLVDFGTVTKWVFFAGLIGFASGLAGVVFHWLVHEAQVWITGRALGTTAEGIGASDALPWLVLAIPAAGGLLTGILVQWIAPEAEGHGTDAVIRSFHRLKGVIRKRVIAVKAITSAITIGSGGSAGQEGPVAQVGAGVGSALAAAFKLSERDRRVCLLAGASGGIGAMFGSPLGGALFMPEVLYRDPEFEGDSIIPCIISSIFAYATFTAISGEFRVIPISPEIAETLVFRPPQILPYMALAVICTIFGWLHVRVFYGVHGLFARLNRVPAFLRPALGGLLVGATALAIAPFAGEQGVLFGGYGLIRASIGGLVPVWILAALVIAKIGATAFSISSGGSGGVFAPSLAIGALIGGAVGQATSELFPALEINPAAFALVGMGGFFAGVAKVPIASVIMVCEMTGNYVLLAPLMLVSVLHVMLSRGWSLYNQQVGGLLDSPAHAGDFVVDVLSGIQVAELVREARPPHLIHQDTTLTQVLRAVADARESYFPVVDSEDHLVGIFSLTDIRRLYLEGDVGRFILVRDFMVESVVTAEPQENLDEVLRRMTANNINALPVMAPGGEGKVLAVLERNEIGHAYDRRLRALKTGELAAASLRRRS
jgi:CIC family chloride channel protein